MRITEEIDAPGGGDESKPSQRVPDHAEAQRANGENGDEHPSRRMHRYEYAFGGLKQMIVLVGHVFLSRGCFRDGHYTRLVRGVQMVASGAWKAAYGLFIRGPGYA